MINLILKTRTNSKEVSDFERLFMPSIVVNGDRSYQIYMFSKKDLW
jgi:hypothetical protein